jgi:thioredoxin reductase (NADPH)
VIDVLDCLIIGGGPAGLTAALYMARFKRKFRLVDAGETRAAWIPLSHNVPGFGDGLSGENLLKGQREQLARYGAAPEIGNVVLLREQPNYFEAACDFEIRTEYVRARCVLLATGSKDVEPELPNLRDAIQRGLISYCPVCDGYEASGKRIAVLGHGIEGLGEAIFVARTYSQDVTFLSLGEGLVINDVLQQHLDQHGVKFVSGPIDKLKVIDGKIAAIQSGGAEYRFDTLYSALGLEHRSGLARSLGAVHGSDGSLIVDEHNQTSVKGLYAAGGAVRGLDQLVTAMAHGAVAATRIHRERTDDESLS